MAAMAYDEQRDQLISETSPLLRQLIACRKSGMTITPTIESDETVQNHDHNPSQTVKTEPILSENVNVRIRFSRFKTFKIFQNSDNYYADCHFKHFRVSIIITVFNFKKML